LRTSLRPGPADLPPIRCRSPPMVPHSLPPVFFHGYFPFYQP